MRVLRSNFLLGKAFFFGERRHDQLGHRYENDAYHRAKDAQDLKQAELFPVEKAVYDTRTDRLSVVKHRSNRKRQVENPIEV